MSSATRSSGHLSRMLMHVQSEINRRLVGDTIGMITDTLSAVSREIEADLDWTTLWSGSLQG